jgi:choline dehydrogenase
MDFDYIIVGAGSAGCVLAERLSRDGASRVLLLEAGTDNRSPLISMPRGMARIWKNPRYFWTFPIAPQAFRPPGEAWFYGKGLGGSSAVNGTWYYRGQPGDYDQWEAQGNTGWTWREIERCYREMEDCRAPGADPSRGRGGPMEITAADCASPLDRAILAAGEQMGLPILADVNQPGTQGIGATQMTVDHRGRRVSAYTAFVKAARGRRNLAIRTGVLVRRVVFEGTRAVGVATGGAGRETIHRAAREVIVCAGVLNSPKLLQISGIGPRELLERFGVGVVCDSPQVGRNMAEHMMLSLSWRLRRIPGLNREFRGWRLAANTLKYFVSGKGLMANVLPEVSAMISTGGDPTWPDVQIGVSPYSMAAAADDKPEAGRGRTEDRPGISVTGFHLRPMSRGVVSIRSGRIEDPPMVEAHWLSAPGDADRALTLMKTMRAIVRQDALAPYVGEETVPGAAVATDEAMLAAIHWMLSTGLHGTGTCRMGPPGRGVVDERLRVRGADALRVVDCSVMPTPISGNTNGPAMAVAWRAAELILEDRDAAAAAGTPASGTDGTPGPARHGAVRA